MRVVLDIETNGLNSDEHIILEVGAIAINDDLTVRHGAVHAEFQVVVAAGSFYRDAASAFVQKMHDDNGLWRECANSNTTRHQADVALAAWLQAHGAEASSVILCGHTISFDHGFIKKQFPITAALLHYRIDDFGAVGRFAREVCGLPVHHTPKELYTHRGLADCWLELEDARALRMLQASALTVCADIAAELLAEASNTDHSPRMCLWLEELALRLTP